MSRVRLYPTGDVHEAGKATTTCGVSRIFARDWIPTDEDVTCRSCVRRIAEREAAETTEFVA